MRGRLVQALPALVFVVQGLQVYVQGLLHPAVHGPKHRHITHRTSAPGERPDGRSPALRPPPLSTQRFALSAGSGQALCQTLVWLTQLGVCWLGALQAFFDDVLDASVSEVRDRVVRVHGDIQLGAICRSPF